MVFLRTHLKHFKFLKDNFLRWFTDSRPDLEETEPKFEKLLRDIEDPNIIYSSEDPREVLFHLRAAHSFYADLGPMKVTNDAMFKTLFIFNNHLLTVSNEVENIYEEFCYRMEFNHNLEGLKDFLMYRLLPVGISTERVIIKTIINHFKSHFLDNFKINLNLH